MATSSVTIYHNPRCSKSRKTLALLQEHSIEPNVVEYLKDPPDKRELKVIVQKLGMKPEQIVRRGEATFKEQFAGKSLGDDEWLEALAEYPILIERPVVISGVRARRCDWGC